jgi:hypothetical protein
MRMSSNIKWHSLLLVGGLFDISDRCTSITHHYSGSLPTRDNTSVSRDREHTGALQNCGFVQGQLWIHKNLGNF